MKQLFYLSLACCMLAFAGCSKDNEEPNYAEPYIGKWVQTAYKASTGAFVGQEDGTYIQFNADGTFTHFYSGWGAINETTTGTYKMPTDFIMKLQIEGNNNSPEIGFYDVEGNTARLQFLFFYTGTYMFEKR